jgi:hypothetical protein
LRDELTATVMTGAMCLINPSSRRNLDQRQFNTVNNTGWLGVHRAALAGRSSPTTVEFSENRNSLRKLWTGVDNSRHRRFQLSPALHRATGSIDLTETAIIPISLL